VAHLGGHGLWPLGPVVGVVLPPLWHQGHKGPTYVQDWGAIMKREIP
jgi:hypothetical protein